MNHHQLIRTRQDYNLTIVPDFLWKKFKFIKKSKAKPSNTGRLISRKISSGQAPRSCWYLIRYIKAPWVEDCSIMVLAKLSESITNPAIFIYPGVWVLDKITSKNYFAYMIFIKLHLVKSFMLAIVQMSYL